MARTGNRHTIADLAAALGAGYVFAVEFVELDLGDARERGWFAGETNDAGLHGAGFVSARPLLDPRLLRLENSGRWFDGAFGERRVGGRIAVMAALEIAGAARAPRLRPLREPHRPRRPPRADPRPPRRDRPRIRPAGRC